MRVSRFLPCDKPKSVVLGCGLWCVFANCRLAGDHAAVLFFFSVCDGINVSAYGGNAVRLLGFFHSY